MTKPPDSNPVPVDLTAQEYRDAQRVASKKGVTVEQYITEKYLKGARKERALSAFCHPKQAH